MNHLRNGYIVKYFKSFYFIPTLFIASILCTLFIGCEGYGIFDALKLGSFSYYLICAGGYFAVIYFVYALAECKNKKLTVVDATNFAIMLTCVIYVLFVLFATKIFHPIKFIIPGVLFLLMTFVTIMRTVYFNPYDDKGKIFYTKNSVNAYYHTLTKQHSFFAIYLFALAMVCLAYLIIVRGFELNVKSQKNIFPLIVLGVLLALTIITSVSKRISVLDSALLGLTISLPVILSQILFLIKDATLKDVYLCYWAISLGVVLILTLLRYIFFDISKIAKNTAERFSDGRIRNYFKKVSHKYGLSIILTTSFVNVIILVLILGFANVTEMYSIVNGEMYITFNLIPALVANLLFIGTIVLGAVMSLANVKAYKITFADFLMLNNLVFSIVAAVLFVLLKIYDWRVYCLCALFAYTVLVTVIRILKSSPKKID